MININNQSIIKRRLIKYGLYLALIHQLLHYGPCTLIQTKERIIISLAASCLFILLDINIPEISINNKSK